MLGSKNEGPKQKQGDIIHVINDKIMKKLFLVPA